MSNNLVDRHAYDGDEIIMASETSCDQEARKIYSETRFRLMNYLARREHSRLELLQKMSKRYDNDTSLLQEILDDLAEEGLQSDARFAESYVRFRSQKGFGPEKISQELRLKGVDENLVNDAIFEQSIDWQELALKQFQKKFKGIKPSCMQEKAKCLRFFMYRGFTREYFPEEIMD